MNLDQIIANNLRAKHEKERLLHEKSGKLSAGRLSKPLLEQCLYLLGVPEKPIDDYTLRLFQRGKQVEEWVVSMLDGEEQVEAEYRGCIGFIDKMMEHPIEVKSIKSSQWKWLQQEGARWSHKLQAGLYALGKNSEQYTIAYVVADDFRTFTYTGETKDVKPEIDSIITEVAEQLKSGTLPAFVAREDWHNKETYSKYSGYPEWLHLQPELAMQKLESQFPEAYKKLTDKEELNG